MKTYHYILALVLPLLLVNVKSAAQSNNKSFTDAGVSFELASYRKKVLSAIAYDLSVTIPDKKEAIVTGNETITFVLTDTKQPVLIDFKAKSSQVKELKINGTKATIVFENEHIVLENNLKKGKNIIFIAFECGNEALKRQSDYLYTFFVPDRARTFFPCFDQPNLKATFTLKATVPLGWTAMTNGKENHKVDTATTSQFSFSKSDTISTYLFSIVAGQFQKATRQLDDHEVNLYYRETNKEKIAESLDTIFEIHHRALKFLEEYTGIPYPFQKLDFVTLPAFDAGGMEHVGLIDYKEETLFLTKTASAQEKMERAQVISHEISHSWFGNLVTMKWFDDVWMKEVFANLMADKIVQNKNTEENNLKFLLAHYPAAYSIDRTLGNHPIRHELTNLNEANTMYGNIIYHKAPIVLRVLEKKLGSDSFRDGLREYLKRYSYKNADWNDLITIFKNSGKNDIVDWNNDWINKAGRPVFSYELTQQDGLITRFTMQQKAEHPNDALGNQRFSIALAYDDHIELIPVEITGTTVDVKEVIGKKNPIYIVFNATGDGYGCFPVDKKMFPYLASFKDPVMRASGYLNLYENMLEMKIAPSELLELYQTNFSKEENSLLLERMKRQYTNAYWQFLTPSNREKLSIAAENKILTTIEEATLESTKRTLFKLYSSISISPNAVNNLYQYWKTKIGPSGIELKEDDLTELAAELALRNHDKTDEILNLQLSRIENKDKKERFHYYFDALSNSTAIRDNYFNSLNNQSAHSNWIPMALVYVHHPLRQQYSEKYLEKTLELIEEFQKTESVFFVSDYLRATFDYYQSKNAATIVNSFLSNHPDYNENIKRKILQETDDLMRTQKLLETK